MKGLYSCMVLLKMRVVLLSSAKWNHDCDPSLALGEHGSRWGQFKEQYAQVHSRRVARGQRKSEEVQNDSEIPPIALTGTKSNLIPLGGLQRLKSGWNKRSQSPSHFGRRQNMQIFRYPGYPDIQISYFLDLYKSYYDISFIIVSIRRWRLVTSGVCPGDWCCVISLPMT